MTPFPNVIAVPFECLPCLQFATFACATVSVFWDLSLCLLTRGVVVPLAAKASPVLARPQSDTCCANVRRDSPFPPQRNMHFKNNEKHSNLFASLRNACASQPSQPSLCCRSPSLTGESANAATDTALCSNILKHPNMRVQVKQKTARLSHRQEKEKGRSHFASACGGGLASFCLLLCSSQRLLQS